MKENNNENLVVALRGHTSPITSIAHKDDIIISGSADGSIYLWRLSQCRKINNKSDVKTLRSWRFKEYREHKNVVWDISTHRSNLVMASISSDQYLRLLNMENNSWIHYNLNSRNPTSLLWNANNSSNDNIMIGTTSGYILEYDCNKSKIVHEYNDASCVINKMAYRGNNTVYAACDDDHIRVFDLKQGKCFSKTRAHTDSVTDIQMIENENVIVSCSHDCRIRIWNLTNLQCAQDVEPQDTHRTKNDEGILAMSYCPSLRMLTSSGADGVIRLYDCL